jgi:deaminated glutathione amidase
MGTVCPGGGAHRSGRRGTLGQVPDPRPDDVLRVALMQAAASSAPASNRAKIGETDVPDADLVVWPEVIQRDLGRPDEDLVPDAETLDGPFVAELVARAADHGGTWVAGMLEQAEEPGLPPYNTLVVVDGGGLRATYRKIHLYDSFGYRESERIRGGATTPVAVEVGGFRVALMTCYDLRFPELARVHSKAGADLFVCPAAWVAGERKVRHWQTLLAARAIENLAYVAAAAQPGPRYCGHSMVVDPRGDVLAEAGEDEDVVVAEVRRDLVEEARRENPSLLNRLDGIDEPLLLG